MTHYKNSNNSVWCKLGAIIQVWRKFLYHLVVQDRFPISSSNFPSIKSFWDSSCSYWGAYLVDFMREISGSRINAQTQTDITGGGVQRENYFLKKYFASLSALICIRLSDEFPSALYWAVQLYSQPATKLLSLHPMTENWLPFIYSIDTFINEFVWVVRLISFTIHQ